MKPEGERGTGLCRPRGAAVTHLPSLQSLLTTVCPVDLPPTGLAPLPPKRAAQAGELSTLKQFRAAFDGVDFSKGTEVVFSQVGGTLTTKVGGAVQSTISSPVLCAALLAVYLGPDPVAKDAKVTFGSNLAAAIKA